MERNLKDSIWFYYISGFNFFVQKSILYGVWNLWGKWKSYDKLQIHKNGQFFASFRCEVSGKVRINCKNIFLKYIFRFFSRLILYGKKLKGFNLVFTIFMILIFSSNDSFVNL